ncbi:MAG: tail fiber protein [Bacteroidetes bacterium]|nr:tail fiber protein [Bacteroidota bacterium]
MTSRSDLKVLFQAGKKPTEDHFAQLIDASINQADDNISIVEGKVSIGIPLILQKKLDVTGDANISGILTVGIIKAVNSNNKLDISAGLNISGGLTINDKEVINSAGEWKGKSNYLWDVDDKGNLSYTKGDVIIGKETLEKTLNVKGDVRISKGLTVGELEVINSAGEWKGKSNYLWEVDKNENLNYIKGNVTIGNDANGKVLDVKGDIKLSGSLFVGEIEVIKPSGELSVASSSFNGVPIGTILHFLGNNVPNGWFACNGQEIVTWDSNPELATFLGWETGMPKNTEFIIPDFESTFPNAKTIIKY